MKIFGICLVKNEADIIEETLVKAIVWCDNIFVYDNGSYDNTWLIVQKLALKYPQIVPYKSEIKPFGDQLRLDVFNEFRHLSNENDWWCRLDSDEIYIDNPKEILAQVNKWHHVVYNESYQFYFTDVDKILWKNSPLIYEKCTDYENILKYYICNWSEIRFFKYRTSLKWEFGSWPLHIGVVSPLKVRLKHYQYRNPLQIQERLLIRQQAAEKGYTNFLAYNSEKNWEEKIMNSSNLNHIDEGWIVNKSNFPDFSEPKIKYFIKLFLHLIKIFP